MKGFIVDATYRIIGGHAYVALFGRLENGEAFLTLNDFRPYFFIKESDLKKAQEIDDFDFEEVKLKTFDEKKVVKIYKEIPSDVAKLRKELEGEKIKTYEADIKFAQRFLIDQKIQAGVEIKGDDEYQDGIKVFKNPELKSCEAKVNLKILSIDIETERNTKEIYCISLVMDDYKKVLIVSEKNLKLAESFKTEKEMLERFFVLIKELDPDMITGWSVIDFDLKVIQKRCKKLEVPFILGRMNNTSKLILREGFFESSKAIAEGRQVIDLMAWVKSNLKLEDYKLETAAQYYVGEGKNVQFIDKGDEIEKLFLKDQQKLVYYNLKDSELVLNVLKKSNLLALYVKRSFLTGLMLDSVRGSIASLDSIYLKKLRDRGYVAPTLEHNVKEEPITGAYVMESKPGLYDNIVVMDYKSLYPSIMRTFNIDPLTFGKKGIKAPNGATFSREEGIMPEIIEHLAAVREEYKKNKDETGRYAIKILLNSFYGVMASPMCRYYNLELANAITAFSRFFVKKMGSWIREEGYEVIYQDSITKNRFVTLLINDELKIINIEELFLSFASEKYSERGKEFIDLTKKNICALTLNKQTLEPEFSLITRIIRHKSNKKIFFISQKYGMTECTEDHSLMTMIKKELVSVKPFEMDTNSLVKVNIPKLKSIQEIDLLDYLKNYSFKTIYKGREKISSIHYNDNYIWFGWVYMCSPILLKRRINIHSVEFKSLCRLLGAYISEGSSSTPETTKSRIGASIASSNTDWLKHIMEDYNSIFVNVKASILKSTNKMRDLRYGNKWVIYEDKTYKIQMMNQISAVFFKCLCGQKSIGKRIPSFMFHVPKEYQMLMLDRMIEGDGSKSKDKRYSENYKLKNFSYCTSSLGLICDLGTLLTQMGLIYSLNYDLKKKSYSIITSSRNNKRLRSLVLEEDYKGYVYDLSVDKNNMFVDACGNILLHNTDSAFVVAKDDPKKVGKELEIKMNKILKDYIKDEYNVECYLYLEFDKAYTKFLMPRLRGEEKGAKKRYAGLIDDKLDITGMEAIRSDWTPLAKKFQEDLLMRVFTGRKVEDFIFNFIKDLKNGKYDDLLVYKKGLQKPLDEYTKTTPPHVKAARKIKNFKGYVVRYVYTTEGVEPVELMKGKYDYEHYINKQIKPIADAILSFIDLKFEDMISGQRSLKGFSLDE